MLCLAAAAHKGENVDLQARAVAFYMPQYFPIPQNNEWWGPGFTVEAAVASVQERPEQERILRVKSWNEWAEGNHLEPDLKYGRGWLEALRAGLTRGR
jgi:hypothetical protein